MLVQILVVAPAAGTIVERIANAIGDPAPRVLHSPTGAEAIKLVQSTPMLAMVVVDGRIGTIEATELVTSLKTTHPDLPLLWVGGGWKDSEPHGLHPDGFLDDDDTDFSSLDGHAKRLLRPQLYERDTVELVQRSAEAVLIESFKTTATAGEAFLKANRHTMAPITAILSFAGPGISGQLVVSGSVEHLATIWRRVLPKQLNVPTDKLEDIAGEMANQTLGRIKRVFVGQGQPFDIGSPVFVRGDMVEIRYKVDRPSLLFALQEPAGTIYVQFCFDSYDPERASKEAAEETLGDGGEVTFL